VALLLDLASDGTTVVVATHDRDVAAAMSREIHLRDGRVASNELPGVGTR
jgi:putative ABC transport system ATP-binding protein